VHVLHVIPSLSPSQGGPSFALPAMARALHAEGVEVDVATTDDDGPGRHLSLGTGPAEHWGYRVWSFPKQTEFYKLSLPLARWLNRHVREYDLVHIHAVFSFATVAAARAARRAGVPYLVRPLGVLNRWGMEQRRPWLKALSFRLLDKPLLDCAAGLHFTSLQERDEAAGLGLRAPAQVLPLGFDLGEFDSLPPAPVFHAAFADTADRPLVLYLSRLDPKKNLEGLLEAWAQVSGPARLVIAGEGDAAYTAALRERAAQLGLGERVLWTGRLQGECKRAALAAATLFVLPSRSENFGIALLEAMAAGLPCVSTPGVALATEAEGSVRVVAAEPAALAGALNRLLEDPAERTRLGAAARELARRKYTLLAMGRELKAWYEEVTHAAA
jgi:glycosyltransferase involved in cell wall biosynthesis